MLLSFLSWDLAPQSFGRLRARVPEQSVRKVVLAEWRSLVSGGKAGPADLLAKSSPPIVAKEMVVGLGDAPSNSCMSGR